MRLWAIIVDGSSGVAVELLEIIIGKSGDVVVSTV